MSVNSVPTSPLLKLPGELRNCIYNYAQDPRDVRLIHKPAQQHEQTNTTERQFFGLTQVCRQLRSEYLPTYRAQTKVHIQCLDSLSYINTFILPAGVEPTLARGDLTVEMPDSAFESRGKLSPQRDIIHLINLCKSAPQVNVAFALPDASPLQHRPATTQFSPRRMLRIMSTLTQPEAAPGLHAFIQDSVEHVECWLNTEQSPSLFFWTKKGCAEKWMHAWSCKCVGSSAAGEDSPGDRMTQWMKEMRLHDPMHHVNEYVNIAFIVDEKWTRCLSDEC